MCPKQLEKIIEDFGPQKRRPPQFPLRKLVSSLVFHSVQGSSTFAANVKHLTGDQISDSALSQRRDETPTSTGDRARPVVFFSARAESSLQNRN